jgi:hypothetical protein
VRSPELVRACLDCPRRVRGMCQNQPRRKDNMTTDPTPTRAQVTRFRCRAHPDAQVTWRGTGCKVCQQAKPARRDEDRRRHEDDAITIETVPTPRRWAR